MAEEFAKQDEYTGQEPAVNNGQPEEKQGRRKSRALSVFVIILVVAFVGYLVPWKCGYRFTSRSLLRTDVLAGESSLQIAEDEFVFDCIVSEGFGTVRNGTISSVNVIKKSSFLYRKLSEDSDCISKFSLQNKAKEDLATVMIVEGAERNFLFFSWIYDSVDPNDRVENESGMVLALKPRLYSEYVTINGTSQKLMNKSYVAVSGEVLSIVINGVELSMVPQ